MQRTRYLPDPERMSVLAATILLAYALARFIDLPVREFALQLPVFYFSIEFNVQTLVTLIVAGLTAAGAEWLLRDHPAISREKYSTIHWLLPGLTALVIGLPLLQVQPGPTWWVGFILGGGLLMLVQVAEYIVVDPHDIRQPLAAATLTAVSFALFLILSVTMQYAEMRLFFILPAVFLAVFLVSLRTLHLRLQQQWAFLEAAIIAFIVCQWAAALHYLPLSPITYGLVLLGPAYFMTSLIAGLIEGRSVRQAVIEPLVILLLVWGIALWLD